MATIQKPKTTPQTRESSFGLLANGTSGAWQVAVDEALSGSERWRAKLKGRS